MKTNTTFRTLAVIACALTVGISTAGDDSAALKNSYARLCKAIMRMDMSASHAMLAPDFTRVDPKGHAMTRAEFIAMDKERMKMPGLKFHEVSMKNDSYDFMGKEARVRSTGTFVMSMMEGGKRMKMKAWSEGVDSWRKTPKGWRIYKVEVTAEGYEPIQ